MAEMRELLSKADEVIADDNATVDDVSNAIKDVDKKIDELKFNRELITSLIEKAKSYDFNNYTDETVEALKNAIKEAEELLIKDNGCFKLIKYGILPLFKIPQKDISQLILFSKNIPIISLLNEGYNLLIE